MNHNLLSCCKTKTCLYSISEEVLITYSCFISFSFTQVWETKKVCKNSAVVLKQEIDVVFQENEMMVLAVDNIRGLQVSEWILENIGSIVLIELILFSY